MVEANLPTDEKILSYNARIVNPLLQKSWNFLHGVCDRAHAKESKKRANVVAHHGGQSGGDRAYQKKQS